MNIYTKTGDNGTTSLLSKGRVSKFDERVELMGTLDELNSQLGLAKVLLCSKGKENIEAIQNNLMQIISGVADSSNVNYKTTDAMIENLEKIIDKTESLFPREHKFVLYGGCEESARLDVARAICRRVERRFAKVNQIYGADIRAMAYINRLSDFLYVYARYIDFKSK